tara:strand:- start:1986 stop:3491 length:1506 start_codon:yes stop_codon:yes gene_type:complete
MNTKLIKLNTFDNNAVFDTNFNDEIIIEPYSEIAFHSISMKRNNARLVVDAFNDTITFQVVGTDANGFGGLHSINLDHDTYSKIHKEDLFNQLNHKANALLSINNAKELGTEIKFTVDGSNKFNFKAQHLPYANASSNNVSNLRFIGLSNSNNKTSRDVGALTGLLKDNYLYSQVPFTKGAGVARLKIDTLVQPADPAEPNGVGVGLTTQIEKLTNGTITFDDLDYAVSTGTSPAQPYRIRLPTSVNFSNTPTNPSYTGVGHKNNDVFGINLDQGQIKIIAHQNNNVNVELAIEDYDANKTYYVVYFCIGAVTNSVFTKALYNITPYGSPNASTHLSIGEEDETDLTAPRPPRTRAGRSNYALNFPNESTAEYFGFRKPNFSSDAPVLSFTIQAPNIFSNNADSDNYLVEMLNIPSLDCYDSFINQKMNLLAVIPVSERIIDNITGLIQYSDNYPTFISMNNKNKLSLRNIRARVLTADHQQIVTDGLSSLNIVIRNKREE